MAGGKVTPALIDCPGEAREKEMKLRMEEGSEARRPGGGGDEDEGEVCGNGEDERNEWEEMIRRLVEGGQTRNEGEEGGGEDEAREGGSDEGSGNDEEGGLSDGGDAVRHDGVSDEGGGGEGRVIPRLREGSLLNLGFTKVTNIGPVIERRDFPHCEKGKRKRARKVIVTGNQPQHGISDGIRKYLTPRRLIKANL